MRKVRCYACGKGYDYDDDGFCPNCGSFNLPKKSSSIGADGAVIRRDGINERNHKGSFVHAELHEENRERKGTLLEQSVKRVARMTTGQSREEGKKRISVMTAVILAIVAMNIFSSLIALLFY